MDSQIERKRQTDRQRERETEREREREREGERERDGERQTDRERKDKLHAQQGMAGQKQFDENSVARYSSNEAALSNTPAAVASGAFSSARKRCNGISNSGCWNRR